MEYHFTGTGASPDFTFIKDIKSFDDLEGLNAIPADTKFVV